MGWSTPVAVPHMPDLPYPRPEDVQSFKTLVKELLGIELTDAEALDGAIRVLGVWYLQHYGIHPLCMPTGQYRKNDRPDKSYRDPEE